MATHRSKRKRIRDQLRLTPDESSAAIAKMLGVSDHTVSEIKREIQEAEAERERTRRKRILLIDDDREAVESMRIALDASGFETFIAPDGKEGLALAEKEDPDLIILEMMLPIENGFLVLEHLRRTRPVPLRVIMLSANEGARHKAYAEMLGVDDYIRKPFAMDRLLDSVCRLMQ